MGGPLDSSHPPRSPGSDVPPPAAKDPAMSDAQDPISRSLSADQMPSLEESMLLLRRAQSGDRDALEDLVRRYQERLRRIVRIQLRGSLLRRHLDSMDLVQDTFRAALPKLAELRPQGPASFLHWLSVIAVHRIRDVYASYRTRKRDADLAVELNESVCRRLGAGEDLPHEQAILAEVRELLDAEVSVLPDDQRQVVVLRDYIGQDWDRIAAELGRENGAVRQLHQRAWIRLRRVLGPKLRGKS